ncbi:MAG: hypothetical protein LC746_14230 [Acidobacteria bacterium]|nr:hypothetical protein [Acidobacteriota bacterium]
MRWKLLIAATLLATVVGAGSFAAINHVLSNSFDRPGKVMFLAPLTLLLPLASIIYAAIFVYRHTARRRKLQAVLIALLTLLLIVASLFATGVILSPRGSGTLPNIY